MTLGYNKNKNSKKSINWVQPAQK